MDKTYVYIYIIAGILFSSAAVVLSLMPYMDLGALEARVRAPAGTTEYLPTAQTTGEPYVSVRSQTSGWWIRVEVEWNNSSPAGSWTWRKKVSHNRVDYGLEMRIFETCSQSQGPSSPEVQCRRVDDGSSGYTSDWIAYTQPLAYREVIRLRYLSGNVRELASTMYTVEPAVSVQQNTTTPTQPNVQSSPVVSTNTGGGTSGTGGQDTLQNPIPSPVNTGGYQGMDEPVTLTAPAELSQDGEWASQKEEITLLGRILRFFEGLF